VGRAAAVLLLLAAVATSGAAATGERTSRPTLTLTSAAPLRVAGWSFLAGERVRVSALSTRKASKVAVANNSGRFTVTLNIGYDRCNGLLVTAVGSRGSRTTLKRPELMCPPRL
jgi:hypothetical protein